MKHMKKLAALLLALVMALALAVPAMAAEETVEVGTTGHTYTVYQIFAGDQVAGSATLGNIKWGKGIDDYKLISQLKADSRLVVNGKNVFKDIDENIEDTAITAAQVAAVLGAYADNSNVARVFAAVAATANCFNRGSVVGTVTDETTTLELDPGYYLIVDKASQYQDASNSSLLQVTNKGKFTIQKKYDLPTLKKQVKDANGAWSDAASWSIGDNVEFQLVGTLPMNYLEYPVYEYKFWDWLGDNFSYNGDAKAYYVDAAGKETEINASSFTVKTDGMYLNGAEEKCNLWIGFSDLKQAVNISDTTNCKIVVKYSAKLLTTAAIGKNGNENKALLTYSAFVDGSIAAVKGTSVDTVMVFTNEFDITKVDGADNSKKLQGAEFKLEKDGKYVTVDSASRVSGWVGTLAAGSTLTSGADGLVKIIGLGEGTYKLHEIKAPAGYNVLTAPIEVVITDVTGTDTETGRPKLNRLTIALDGGDAQNGDVTTGLVTATVQNNTGASLPETGGVGTTLFYIIGGMLMVGAAVLLVTRKRMSDAK